MKIKVTLVTLFLITSWRASAQFHIIANKKFPSSSLTKAQLKSYFKANNSSINGNNNIRLVLMNPTLEDANLFAKSYLNLTATQLKLHILLKIFSGKLRNNPVYVTDNVSMVNEVSKPGNYLGYISKKIKPESKDIKIITIR